MKKQKELEEILKQPSYFPKRVQLSKCRSAAVLYSLPYRKGTDMLPKELLTPANRNDF